MTLELISLERYARQMILPEMGLEAQNKLKKAKVLVIGAGGIGSSVLLYLTGAGIGTIGVVDGDTVDRTNLHRQVLHSSEDVGSLKVDSAKRRMNKLNDFVNVITFPTRITKHNADEIVKDFDLVIDGSDNALTRYLVNDICVIQNVSRNAKKRQNFEFLSFSDFFEESADQWSGCEVGWPADCL